MSAIHALSAEVYSPSGRGHHGSQEARGFHTDLSGVSPMPTETKIFIAIEGDRAEEQASLVAKPVDDPIRVPTFDVDDEGRIRRNDYNRKLAMDLCLALQVGGCSGSHGEAVTTKDTDRGVEEQAQCPDRAAGVGEEMVLKAGGRRRQGDQGADGDQGDEGRTTRGAERRREQEETDAQLARIFDLRRFSLPLLKELTSSFKEDDVLTAMPDREWMVKMRKSKRSYPERYVTKDALLAGLLRIVEESGRQDEILLLRPFRIDVTPITRDTLLKQSIRGKEPKMIIAPIHYLNHWTAIMVQMDTGVGVIYDSTHYEQEAERKADVIAWANQHLSTLVNGSVKLKLRYARKDYHLQQRDHFNCSFFTMQHIRGYLDGRHKIGLKYRFNSEAIRRDLVEWIHAVRRHMETVIVPYIRGAPAHRPYGLPFLPPPGPGTWIGSRRTSGRDHTRTNLKIKATMEALAGSRRRRTVVVASPPPVVAPTTPPPVIAPTRGSIVGSPAQAPTGSPSPPSAPSSSAVGSMDLVGSIVVPTTPASTITRRRRMESDEEAGPSKRVMDQPGPSHQGQWRRSTTTGLATRNVNVRSVVRRRLESDDDEATPSKRRSMDEQGPSSPRPRRNAIAELMRNLDKIRDENH